MSLPPTLMPSSSSRAVPPQEASSVSAHSVATAVVAHRPLHPKPVLRRIASPSHRQVTFSKRRTDLLKKSYELAVLCNAEVATIVFSSTGRVSEFSSRSMSKIIKRYEDLQPRTSSKNVLQEREYWNHESLEFPKQTGLLNDLQSFLMEEDAMNLSVSEVQKVESELQLIMNKIRAQKMELFEIQTQELRNKLTEMMDNNGENLPSCEMSGSTTSELVDGPPIDTKLKLG